MKKITFKFLAVCCGLLLLPFSTQAQSEIQASLGRAPQTLTTQTATTAPQQIMNSVLADGDVRALNIVGGGGGVYGTFPILGPFDITQLGTNESAIFASDTDGSGTLYGIDQNTLSLVTINPTNGSSTTVAPLTGFVAGQTATGLSWDATSMTMYALGTDGVVTSFYSIDLATATMTLIGETGTALGIWIAIDRDGVCFMADIGDDQLHTIDLSTGVATAVGPLGVDLNFAQEADVDRATNTLYMAGYLISQTSSVYSINKMTGAATDLGTLNGAELGIFDIEGEASNFSCDSTLIEVGLGITVSEGPSNTEGGASNVCQMGATDAVWYRYTAANSGDLTISSDLETNGAVNTRVSVYNDDCGALVCLASDDNSGTDDTSTVTLTVESGTTYYIEWDDANDDAAFDFELSLDIFCPDPENFMTTALTDTTADFSWDEVAEAVTGYELAVFEAGADPEVDTAIYTETIATGTTAATATGLSGTTLYDAYLTADCGMTDGISNAVSITFETLVTPPACGGQFFDTGGPNNPYENNEDYSLLITNDDANNLISLVFTAVDIEPNFDFLRIYDGDDATAPELSGAAQGIQIPETITSNIPGGNLFITFTSDGSVTREGWVADVLCEEAPSCLTPFDLTISDITETSATASWDYNGTNATGFNVSVFEAGADPEMDTPIFTETTAADVLTSAIIGLSGSSSYDVYVEADCGSEDISEAETVSFDTEVSDPACGGSFFDTGGPNGQYMNSENYSFLIENTGDMAIVLEFTFVDIEASFDFLRIYDGDDATAPEISDPTNGVQEPGSFASAVLGGNLFVTFSSDGSVTRDGWEANVTCDNLGLGELSETNLTYYPNPTSDILNIDSRNVIDQIEVYNIFGQRVLSLKPQGTQIAIDLSGLAVGTYFMKTLSEQSQSVHKIIRK